MRSLAPISPSRTPMCDAGRCMSLHQCQQQLRQRQIIIVISARSWRRCVRCRRVQCAIDCVATTAIPASVSDFELACCLRMLSLNRLQLFCFYSCVMTVKPGGVARNIAASIARSLSLQQSSSSSSSSVHLLSIVADDAFGRFVLDATRRSNVRCDDVIVVEPNATTRTAVYNAILDERGEMDVSREVDFIAIRN